MEKLPAEIANWILMGVGLVLMVAPWIWYFAIRKGDRKKESSLVRNSPDKDSNG